MRAFLLSACPALVWVVTALQLLFMILALRSYRTEKEPLFLLTALVALGLFYDALILSLGGVMGDGAPLRLLSRFRFVAHGGLIPLLFPICAYALRFRKPWKTAVWIFTGVLIALGIAEGFSTVLQMQQVAGIVRYTAGEGTPAWAKAVSGVLSYGTVVPLMLAGVAVWIRQKTPYLFLSGAVMFFFSALGPATGNFDLIFFISMFGEVGMALFFLLYAGKAAAARAVK